MNLKEVIYKVLEDSTDGDNTVKINGGQFIYKVSNYTSMVSYNLSYNNRSVVILSSNSTYIIHDNSVLDGDKKEVDNIEDVSKIVNGILVLGDFKYLDIL